MDKKGKVILFGLVLAIVVFACGCIDEPTNNVNNVPDEIGVNYSFPKDIDVKTASWSGYGFSQELRFDITNTNETTSDSLYITATAYTIDNVELGKDYTNTVGIASGQTKRMEVSFYDKDRIGRIEIIART